MIAQDIFGSHSHKASDENKVRTLKHSPSPVHVRKQRGNTILAIAVKK